MAFSSIIRRTASFVAPLAIRVLETRRYYHPALFSAVNGNICRSGAHFSSVALKAKSDETVLRVIESEIKCAEESDDPDRVEEIPGGFPFSIQDNPGTQNITLTREYNGQAIKVKVYMSNLVTGDDDNDDDDHDSHEEKGAQPSIPLVINVVSKGNVKASLEFSCTAYPDEVSIDGLAVREQEEQSDDKGSDIPSEVKVAYEGPDFSDLDENLQKAFHKYLEIRGIKPSTTNFLHEYMINKDSREYLLWLRNLKNFIEK